MNETKLYYDKPIFGIDIGFNSIKVMQVDAHGNSRKVLGYGSTRFDQSAFKDGEIVDPEKIAGATHELFEKHLIGSISTHRVAISVPASKTFNRTVQFPKIEKKDDLEQAVRLEAEQYIPVPIGDLYLDYSVVSQHDKGTEVLVTAAPKETINSYTAITHLLGLEPIAIETTIAASGRLFQQTEQDNMPSILIDFGSLSSDVTIYDKTIVVTGTISGGGDNFSELIRKKLNVSKAEADVIKTKYGMGVSKKQKEINQALEPVLDQLVREIKRMVRYYTERKNSEQDIEQVVTLGGGANMPGLSEYLTNSLRMPVRMCNPWESLSFGKLQPPNQVEKSTYITVAGLAFMNPREVFHD